MQSYKDNHLIVDKCPVFELAVLSVLGDREQQEDSFGYYMADLEGIVTVCDGMGGHEGGKLASSIAVRQMLLSYQQSIAQLESSKFLLDALQTANKQIASLQFPDGTPMHAGSTIVSVVVKEKSLYWVSIGDSRIYLYRNGEFIQITIDHVYRLVLDEQLKNGEIDNETYSNEISKGGALISYLGVEKLNIIDYNTEPFRLLKGDKILLTSDGLYKSLSEEEIKRIVDNFSNIKEAVQALGAKAERNAKGRMISRDNTTIALIQVK